MAFVSGIEGDAGGFLLDEDMEGGDPSVAVEGISFLFVFEGFFEFDDVGGACDAEDVA